MNRTEFDRLTAEKWGQVRCGECRFWNYVFCITDEFFGNCDRLSKESDNALGVFEAEVEVDGISYTHNMAITTRRDFGCVLGEPIQSIGSEVV